MRFPETKIMKRTFDLFEYGPLNSGNISVSDHLIEFHFHQPGPKEDQNGFKLYNGKRWRINKLEAAQEEAIARSLSGDPFHDPFDDFMIGVPAPYLKGVDPISPSY
jgi:hypothetical protein